MSCQAFLPCCLPIQRIIIAVSSPVGRHELTLVARRRRRNPDHEFRTFHRLASYRDRSAMRLDNPLHQVQAKASTVDLVLNGALPAKKWLEDVLLLIRRDARPAVRDTDFNRRSILLRDGGSKDPEGVRHKSEGWLSFLFCCMKPSVIIR